MNEKKQSNVEYLQECLSAVLYKDVTNLIMDYFCAVHYEECDYQHQIRFLHDKVLYGCLNVNWNPERKNEFTQPERAWRILSIDVSDLSLDILQSHKKRVGEIMSLYPWDGLQIDGIIRNIDINNDSEYTIIDELAALGKQFFCAPIRNLIFTERHDEWYSVACTLVESLSPCEPMDTWTVFPLCHNFIHTVHNWRLHAKVLRIKAIPCAFTILRLCQGHINDSSVSTQDKHVVIESNKRQQLLDLYKDLQKALRDYESYCRLTFTSQQEEEEQCLHLTLVAQRQVRVAPDVQLGGLIDDQPLVCLGRFQS